MLAAYAAWAWREERRKEELAWALSYLVNSQGGLKKAIPYEDFLAQLLGPDAMAQRTARVMAERRQHVRARKKKGPR